MRRTSLAAALAVTATLALGACATTGRSADPATAGPADEAFPVTVGKVTLAHRPQRIISLSPTATEMLFAVDAGAQVVAVDDQSDYPADAPKSDLSGVKPNIEAIAAKNPDLVVVSNDIDNMIGQLAVLKIPVYLAPAANTLDDTYTQLSEIGKLTGHATEAGALVQRMRDDIAKLLAEVPKRSKPLRYYYELDQTLYSLTSQTFVGSLLSSVGLADVADGKDPKANPYPQLSAEALVKANPDVIFLADTKCCGQSPRTVKARPGWSSITAVKDGRIVPLDDDIASRWGPRVVDLLRAVVESVSQIPVS